MSQYRFFTADVFTSVIFGGNQLAVFPDARGLSDDCMQSVAREFNLSETVFVLPPNDSRHTRRLRIFTPAAELPFAGHPTIGAAYVLAAIGELLSEDEETELVFEEGVGPVRVLIRQQAGKPVSARLTVAQLPAMGPNPPPRAAIAEILSVAADELLGADWEPASFSCGVPFVLVPLRDREVLRRASLDRASWSRHLASFWASALYPFCFDPELEGSGLRARMFAPAMGIEEDPATGAAAAALAGYLGDRDEMAEGLLQWRVEQGFEMGRPSLLEIQAVKHNGRIVAVHVGGQSVLVSEGKMEIPVD